MLEMFSIDIVLKLEMFSIDIVLIIHKGKCDEMLWHGLAKHKMLLFMAYAGAGTAIVTGTCKKKTKNCHCRKSLDRSETMELQM